MHIWYSFILFLFHTYAFQQDVRQSSPKADFSHLKYAWKSYRNIHNAYKYRIHSNRTRFGKQMPPNRFWGPRKLLSETNYGGHESGTLVARWYGNYCCGFMAKFKDHQQIYRETSMEPLNFILVISMASFRIGILWTDVGEWDGFFFMLGTCVGW